MDEAKVIISMREYKKLNNVNEVLDNIHCLVRDSVRIDFLNNPELPADVEIAFINLMQENYPDIESRILELKAKKEEKENKEDE